MGAANRVAVVTGASSGVGRAASQALLEVGFDVVMAARRLSLIEDAAAAFGRTPGRVLAVQADVTREESVIRLFARAAEAFGRVDLLFNNAGVSVPETPIEDFSLENWRESMDVNLTGPFLCAREAVRLMKSQTPRGGRIINNASVSAQAPRPDSTAYTVAKTGITGLTRCLALDGRKHDIACGQIDIGNAATDMTARMTGGVRQANGAVTPEPRINVGEVARAVVFMAGLPLESNVLHLTIMPAKMPLVGRG